MIQFFLIVAILFSPTATYAFSDIENYPWDDSIEYLQQHDVVDGYEDGSFQPQKTINRAELTKIIIESVYDDSDFGSSAGDCFPDVRATDWFAKYVCFAKENNIVKGYPDGTFRPNNEITQPEAIKIILESFGVEVSPEEKEEWYQSYLEEAEYLGMRYFEPSASATHETTRGEMAYFAAWMLDDEDVVDDQIEPEVFDADVDDYSDIDDQFDWGDMLPEDCAEGEEYDAEDRMCYLVEDEMNSVEDNEQDEPTEAEEDTLEQAYDELSDGLAESDAEEPSAADEDNVVVYSLNGNSISFKENRGDTRTLKTLAEHQKVWERVTQLIPLAYRNTIGEFHIFSDGVDNTMAYVSPVEEKSNQDRWILAVDIADAEADPQELDLTIVHEYGHVLTLGSDQVTPVSAASDQAGQQQCRPQFYTGEGCAKDGSFLDAFFQNFWNGRMIDMLRSGTRADEGSGLSGQFPDHFVTEYASTDPIEDIAESFAYYVIHGAEGGATVKDQKIRFFENFPSLVKLRADMRESLFQR